MYAFVLVHSPLVGLYTWEPVAAKLSERGYEVVLPHLTNSEADSRSYWEQHADAIARAARSLSTGRTVALVGHSGAGARLPVAGQALHTERRYIFVDSDIPTHGKSMLDRFAPEDAEGFRRRAVDGYIQPWSEDQLAQAIPDPVVRHRFVSELVPVPLMVYEEPIPLPPDWPDAPCGYISFTGTGAYGKAVNESKARGWPTLEMPGEHFHMLVDPPAVADALVNLIARLQA